MFKEWFSKYWQNTYIPAANLKPFVLLFTVGLSLIVVTQALGQPPAPAPILPAPGAFVITPTFSWQTSAGAVTYEVQVGPQSDPNSVIWSASTMQLELTPVDALFNGALYWRVRACEAGPICGSWSSRVDFTKYIPTPVLIAPEDYAAIIEPSLIWEPVEGAASYKVEFSLVSTFDTVAATYTTYNTRLTPVGALANATYYWRVRGVDAVGTAGHEGYNSGVRVFTKIIPAPRLESPAEGSNVVEPLFEWLSAAGAAFYTLELSAAPSFTPILATYTTYNQKLAPLTALANGTYYWRVRGMDAKGNEGTNSATSSFIKILPPPILIGPADTAQVSLPLLEWQPAQGGAAYKVELSTVPTFIPVAATDTTYNTRLAPADALTNGTYYWRVRTMDAQGNEGANSPVRSFTLTDSAISPGTTPELILPGDGETLAVDPQFYWTPVTGAVHYRVIVSLFADFHSMYDTVDTHTLAYIPYTPGSRDQYPNGTYYWKVQARSSSGTLISESTGRSFVKQATLTLAGPAESALLAEDPVFQWARLPGAKDFRLLVSQYADFLVIYDTVNPDDTTYVPYTPGSRDQYPNGTYFWKVQAYSPSEQIVESEARSFTRQTTLNLVWPDEGSILLEDPTFHWEPVLGVRDYQLLVSLFADFHTIYDVVNPTYPTYSPYTPGSRDNYLNGVYYWKVRAYTSGGVILAESPARHFEKQTSLPLYNPPEAVMLGSTPSFRWGWVVGAKSYRLTISHFADFHVVYDQVIVDYPTYTPYTPGSRDTYEGGDYFWKVDAQDASGNAITTSLVGTFSISGGVPTSTPYGAPTATDTLTPTPLPPTNTPTATLAPPITPGPDPTALPTPLGQRALGNVVVYADMFTEQGNGTNIWKAEGYVRLGSTTAANVQLSTGTVILNFGAMSIQGSSDSGVALILDNGSTAPMFTGPFSVNSSTGELSPQGVTYQLSHLGDITLVNNTPLANFIMNVLQGTARGQAGIYLYPIEGIYPITLMEFTLFANRRVTGTISNLEFEAAGVYFAAEEASFSYQSTSGGRITIGHAVVTLPPAFDLGGEGWVDNLAIDQDGLDVGGGGISLTLPEMSVPGTDGAFELASGEFTLSIVEGQYLISGRADFNLPNIASTGEPGGSYDGKLYAEFELDQGGLNYVLMGGEVSPGIPIGQSGMVLSSLEGRVTLDPVVRVQITGTIQSALEVPVLDMPVISATPTLWVQLSEPYEVGISGEVQVLIFDAAQATLVLSQSDGLRGSVQINYLPYAMSGEASLHVWRSNGAFHFTGSATVTLGFHKGDLYSSCWEVCIPVWGCENICLNLPPIDLVAAEVGCELGEFCENSSCSSTVYGLKGFVETPIWDGTVFIDTSGDLLYGSDAEALALFDQGDGRAGLAAMGPLTTTYTDTYTVTVGTTDQLLFMLGWSAGDPTINLLDPNGHRIDPGIDPDVNYTEVVTNAFFTINAPLAGIWTAKIGNLTGNEFYLLNVWGGNLPPTVTITSIASPVTNTFEIHWTAEDPDPEDTPSLELYYDTDAFGTDGTLITAGLAISSSSYLWDASQLPTGQYYLYARIDDRKGMPVTNYYPDPISVYNTQPPAAPINVQAALNDSATTLQVCWNRNSEADVVGYRVYFGTNPGLYDLAVVDATNVSCYNLAVPGWLDVGYVAVTAYDNSGNSSSLSVEQEVLILRNRRVYLPFVLKQ